MTDHTVEGRVWKFGTDIDTDVIIPSQYMRLPPEEYTDHVLEPIRPSFSEEVQPGDIVVAERNFGIGSSREHAAIALERAGVGAIVAESFGRIFFRNAINQGLPAIRADMAVIDAIEEGETLRADYDGSIHLLDTDDTYDVEPLTGIARSIIKAGGAEEYYTS